MAKKKKKGTAPADAGGEGPAEKDVMYGKLGHNCPLGCYNAGSAQLFWSKKDPGMLECPSCGETFEPIENAEKEEEEEAETSA